MEPRASFCSDLHRFLHKNTDRFRHGRTNIWIPLGRAHWGLTVECLHSRSCAVLHGPSILPRRPAQTAQATSAQVLTGSYCPKWVQ